MARRSTGVCATRGAEITEGLALAYAKPFEEGAVDFDEPLLRTVADELAALKRRVDRRVTELPPTPLADGASAQLQPSTARALRRRRLRDQALRRDAAGPQRGLL